MITEKPGISRRDMLKKGAVAGAVFWSVPVIESITSAAAAGSGSLITCSFTFVVWKDSTGTYVSGYNNLSSGCTNFGGKPGPFPWTCGSSTYTYDSGQVYPGSSATGTAVTRATATQCAAALTQVGNVVTANSGVTIIMAISFGGGSYAGACPVANTITVCNGLA